MADHRHQSDDILDSNMSDGATSGSTSGEPAQAQQRATEETDLTTVRNGGLSRFTYSSMKDLHEHTHIPCTDEHGNLVHVPREVDGRSVLPTNQVEPPQRWLAQFRSAIEVFQYIYSLALLIFSVTLVMTAMFTKQTVATGEAPQLPPIAALLIFWFLILWLATMEGGQGALVGLKPVDPLLYLETHPKAGLSTHLAHRNNNMERFIVGRQFLVVLVVFAINVVAAAIPDASVLNLPSIMNDIFLVSGLALILTTIILGQLTAQVNAANCMLDFINNYFMLFTVYVSLAMEASGLLHSVYLVQMLFTKLSGHSVTEDSNAQQRPRPSVCTRILFWLRVVLSLAVLGLSFAVTLSALFEGKTTMYKGVPNWASVAILFVLMCFVGLMDGMQIALFAVVNLPTQELEKHPMAHQCCQLTFQGNNLQAFLIGRQILVTMCMFIVARITSIDVNVETDDAENIFGVSDGVQSFFNTGLLGAIITTLVASLAWRIIASSFPVAFLSNPLIYVIIRLCLALEASGICSAAWCLAYVQKYVFGYQIDEVFIGTSEERNVILTDLELQEERSNA